MASATLRPIRVALAVAVVAAALAIAASVQSSPPSASVNNQPVRQHVLVELFTSEGCSDCPPADALLARLESTQFVPGADAIVLSEHVTYWNHLGWRDPFSFDAMDERQNQYARRFSLDEVYTPQMVVDGAEQFVGSDAAKLSRAVAHAAANPKQEIAIKDARWADGAVHFSAQGPAGSNTTLLAALAENATVSEVRNGENAGRTLHHVAVVRDIEDFGSRADDGRPLSLSGASSFNARETAGPLRLVVFLADRKTGHVVAVGEQTLNR
jgi:hypothetical protein